jgi:hypothetical protein
MDHCSVHWAYRQWCEDCRHQLLAYRAARIAADPREARLWQWLFDSRGPGEDGGVDSKIVLSGLCEALGPKRLEQIMPAVPGLAEFLTWCAKAREQDEVFEQNRRAKEESIDRAELARLRAKYEVDDINELLEP